MNRSRERQGPTLPPEAGDPTVDSGKPADDLRGGYQTLPASRYHLGAPLGRGGMGEVHAAYDARLVRTVALKSLRQARPSQEVAARFLREAQLTGQLEHPNIVPVYDIGTDAEGRIFYTMKRVVGRSLAAAVRGAHLSQVRSLQVFVQVCDAVAFAHARAIIHRDIKPANVMIGDFGEVLVLDWGLAKPVGEASGETRRPDPGFVPDDLTRDDVVLGTPTWMGPEQAAGDEASAATDQYALGAVLYFLLTGHPPFTPSADVLDRVAAGQFRPPRAVRGDVPRELEAICLRAMARDPHRRYPSVTALRDDVQAWLEGREVRAMHYSLAMRTTRFARRHLRTLVVAAGVTSLAITLFLGASILGGTLYVSNTRASEARAAAAERQATLRLADSLVALSQVHAEVGRADEARRELEEADRTYASLSTPPPPAAVFARAFIEYRSPAALAAWTLPPNVIVSKSVFRPDEQELVLLLSDGSGWRLDPTTGVTRAQLPASERIRWLGGTYSPEGALRVVWRDQGALWTAI